jgi:hypothetical protein
VRGRHPSWGAKKRLSSLHTRHPRWALPGRSTVCGLLRRQGVVPKKRPPRHMGQPGKPTRPILAPTDVWSAECNGQLNSGDGRYCDP